MPEKEFILTQEGYDNLEKELEELKTTTRYEIAERIRVALGFGDLSENSEYDEAKNAQAQNEMKIAELEEKLKYAKIIDEYFDRYGYATKRNKKPNRNVRPHWCYTKTIGCTITGSIPCDDATKICNIYKNGITFWMNGSEVGNYSLDNTV